MSPKKDTPSQRITRWTFLNAALLTAKEAAQFLNMSYDQLRQWHCRDYFEKTLIGRVGEGRRMYSGNDICLLSAINYLLLNSVPLEIAAVQATTYVKPRLHSFVGAVDRDESGPGLVLISFFRDGDWEFVPVDGRAQSPPTELPFAYHVLYVDKLIDGVMTRYSDLLDELGIEPTDDAE